MPCYGWRRANSISKNEPAVHDRKKHRTFATQRAIDFLAHAPDGAIDGGLVVDQIGALQRIGQRMGVRHNYLMH